jgi:ATP-dependent DNA helicase RecQ
MERARIWQAIKEGRLKLLYLSPSSWARAAQGGPRPAEAQQIIVDEVHCVSQWATISARLTQSGNASGTLPRGLRRRLHATADRVTREDIKGQLFDARDAGSSSTASTGRTSASG